MNTESYFHLYEDRYRRLRQQGVTFWTPDPAEQARLVEEVMRFLAGYKPEQTSLVEFGCGEGFLAEHVLKLGFTYTGIDLSPSAIDFARNRYQGSPKAAFILGDVTDLKDIPDSSFDAGLDILFFHMLVTDEHRRKYLSEVRRVLKPEAGALFIENAQPNEFVGQVTSFREFSDTYYGDSPQTDDYPDVKNGEKKTVKLPRIPARFNNEPGYRRELEEAGFVIRDSYTRDRRCIMHLKNRKE